MSTVQCWFCHCQWPTRKWIQNGIKYKCSEDKEHRIATAGSKPRLFRCQQLINIGRMLPVVAMWTLATATQNTHTLTFKTSSTDQQNSRTPTKTHLNTHTVIYIRLKVDVEERRVLANAEICVGGRKSQLLRCQAWRNVDVAFFLCFSFTRTTHVKGNFSFIAWFCPSVEQRKKNQHDPTSHHLEHLQLILSTSSDSFIVNSIGHAHLLDLWLSLVPCWIYIIHTPTVCYLCTHLAEIHSTVVQHTHNTKCSEKGRRRRERLVTEGDEGRKYCDALFVCLVASLVGWL